MLRSADRSTAIRWLSTVVMVCPKQPPQASARRSAAREAAHVKTASATARRAADMPATTATVVPRPAARAFARLPGWQSRAVGPGATRLSGQDDGDQPGGRQRDAGEDRRLHGPSRVWSRDLRGHLAQLQAGDRYPGGDHVAQDHPGAVLVADELD